MIALVIEKSQMLWLLLLQLFFILMLVLPTTFQVPRGIFLVLITSIAVIVSPRIWRIHQDIFMLWLATIIAGIHGVLVGVIHSAPGALKVSTVYLIWPVLYLLFVGLAHELRVVKVIESALLLGIALATAVAFTVMTAGILGYASLILPLFQFQGAAFGNYGGFLEFRTYGLTTVIYGFPFVLSFVLVHRDELRGLQRLTIYLLLFAISLVALASGRRAFWLVLLLAPFICALFLQLSSCRLRPVSFLSLILKSSVVGLLAIGSIVTVFGFDLVAVTKNFVSAFQGVESSSGARYSQAVSLWNSFCEAPLLGQGFGSTVDVVRSHSAPWAYELSYLSLLMNVGLIGFFVYCFTVAWVILKGVELSRKNVEFAKLFIPLVTSLCAFLVINGTNPYLAKFDYLWVVFLPVALINAYLTQRPKHD